MSEAAPRPQLTVVHDADRLRTVEELAAFLVWCNQGGHTVNPYAARVIVTLATRVEVECWTRRDVNLLLMYGALNWCAVERCPVPDGVPEALWWWLHFAAETGRLPAPSDPLENLLEPLQCYGHLDPTGTRAPDGWQPDFPCQCDIPAQPNSKPGLSWWLSYDDTLVELWRPAKSEPPLFEWYRPLAAFARAACQQQVPWPVALDDFEVIGHVPEGKDHPRLWLYVSLLNSGELYLADDGAPFERTTHRGRRLGYRFVAIEVRSAIWRAGIPDVTEPVDRW